MLETVTSAINETIVGVTRRLTGPLDGGLLVKTRILNGYMKNHDDVSYVT